MNDDPSANASGSDPSRAAKYPERYAIDTGDSLVRPIAERGTSESHVDERSGAQRRVYQAPYATSAALGHRSGASGAAHRAHPRTPIPDRGHRSSRIARSREPRTQVGHPGARVLLAPSSGLQAGGATKAQSRLVAAQVQREYEARRQKDQGAEGPRFPRARGLGM